MKVNLIKILTIMNCKQINLWFRPIHLVLPLLDNASLCSSKKRKYLFTPYHIIVSMYLLYFIANISQNSYS